MENEDNKQLMFILRIHNSTLIHYINHGIMNIKRSNTDFELKNINNL